MNFVRVTNGELVCARRTLASSRTYVKDVTSVFISFTKDLLATGEWSGVSKFVNINISLRIR